MKINVNVQVMSVTPEIASEWLLEKWGDQRSVRSAHVARLASDMNAGRFRISPDAILRIDGKLANGQHRLEAVVQSGKEQTFIVMESTDKELYKVLDAGLRRTVSDGLFGCDYFKSLPSIARWVQAYDNQCVCASSRHGSDAISNKNGAARSFPSQAEMIDYCQSNKEVLIEAARFINPLYDKTKLLPPSLGGAVYVIGKTHNKEDEVKKFLKQVYIDGGSSSAGDLRNRLIANSNSKAKLAGGYIFGITIKSFKSFCNGSRPGVLKWAKDEPFPTI